jgi:hypothetical protein
MAYIDLTVDFTRIRSRAKSYTVSLDPEKDLINYERPRYLDVDEKIKHLRFEIEGQIKDLATRYKRVNIIKSFETTDSATDLEVLSEKIAKVL